MPLASGTHGNAQAVEALRDVAKELQAIRKAIEAVQESNAIIADAMTLKTKG